jgi:hypothetical protein
MKALGTQLHPHTHTHHPTYSRIQKSLTQAIVGPDSDDYFKGGRKKGKKERYLPLFGGEDTF